MSDEEGWTALCQKCLIARPVPYSMSLIPPGFVDTRLRVTDPLLERQRREMAHAESGSGLAITHFSWQPILGLTWSRTDP